MALSLGSQESMSIAAKYVREVNRILGKKWHQKNEKLHIGTPDSSDITPAEFLEALAICQASILAKYDQQLSEERRLALEQAYNEAISALKTKAMQGGDAQFEEALARRNNPKIFLRRGNRDGSPLEPLDPKKIHGGPLTVLPNGTALRSQGKSQDDSEIFSFDLDKLNTSDIPAFVQKLRTEYGDGSSVKIDTPGLEQHVLRNFGGRFDMAKIAHNSGVLLFADLLGSDLRQDLITSKWRYLGLGYSKQQRMDKLQIAIFLEGMQPVPCTLADWELEGVQRLLNDPKFQAMNAARKQRNEPLMLNQIDQLLSKYKDPESSNKWKPDANKENHGSVSAKFNIKETTQNVQETVQKEDVKKVTSSVKIRIGPKSSSSSQ